MTLSLPASIAFKHLLPMQLGIQVLFFVHSVVVVAVAVIQFNLKLHSYRIECTTSSATWIEC